MAPTAPLPRICVPEPYRMEVGEDHAGVPVQVPEPSGPIFPRRPPRDAGQGDGGPPRRRSREGERAAEVSGPEWRQPVLERGVVVDASVESLDVSRDDVGLDGIEGPRRCVRPEVSVPIGGPYRAHDAGGMEQEVREDVNRYLGVPFDAVAAQRNVPGDAGRTWVRKRRRLQPEVSLQGIGAVLPVEPPHGPAHALRRVLGPIVILAQHGHRQLNLPVLPRIIPRTSI
jgi:hypothetical protein